MIVRARARRAKARRAARYSRDIGHASCRSGGGRSPRATARGSSATPPGDSASAAISGSDAAGHLAAQRVRARPRRRARRRAAGGSAPGRRRSTSTVCAPRCRSSASVPWSTSRPSRRMPTRSQSASTSLRMCDDRKTVWPRSLGLGTRLAERHLHERVEPARRLVQDQQVGAGRERGDELHLLPVALRERAHLLARVELEPLDQHVAVGARRCRRAGVPRNSSVSAPVRLGQSERLAGDIRHAAVRRPASVHASSPKSSARPAVGAMEPEQQPDGRRLARSIRPQEAIHLAGRDREVERIERERAPVALREDLRADCVHVRQAWQPVEHA